jgi:predicted Rossmann fold flavoprotein
MADTKHYDVIIIGAGGAGLMCAREAGKRGRHVLVIDHANKAGSKILISGGGRCNFTNTEVSAEQYLSANKHFCKSALTQFNQHDFMAMLQKHKIEYHARKLGQQFCDDSAKQIVAMLVSECEANAVTIKLNVQVVNIDKDDSFTVKTNIGTFVTTSLVIATGGLSIPEIGASDFGYKLAKQFGLSVTSTTPALVPLIFNKKDLERYKTLSGMSFEASVRCGKISFREDVLITHRGLSGPAILQISSYWKPGQEIHIHLLPQLNLTEFLQTKRNENPKQELKTVLSEVLAKRLIVRLIETDQIKNMPMWQVSNKHIVELTNFFSDLTIIPSGTEGYNKAEVTLGGIDTRELSGKTLESRKVSGLYFIGEVVDVTGWLGGYNLQWAWSSGAAAGRAV